MELIRSFDIYDYLLMAFTLLISVVIGMFYAFRKGGQKTTDEFLLGDRKMPVLPTALSLLVSFQSGILVLGVSAEMYMKGITYIWYLFGVALGAPLAIVIYLPVFYKLKLVSAYEYFELRFQSRLVRLIATVLFLVSTLLYMSIVLYAPSVALSAVTRINLELLVVVSGLLCTFYTALGGLKAVVWTDAFQAVMMLCGFLAIIIQGFISVGGAKNFWRINAEGGRFVTDMSTTPFTYMNLTGVLVGTALGWMSVYGTNQTAVQRYTSLSSLRKAQCSLMLLLPGVFIMLPLALLSGLVMYAYYAGCDPLTLKAINDRDQLLPYFTMDVLSNAKGVPGLFVSCLVSSTLSTVSSGLNSMAAVVWEDFLKPKYGATLSDRAATRLNKILAVVFGVFAVGFACLIQFLGGVFQAAMSILSVIGGPLSGLFLFGIMFPWGNKYGALAGVILSTLISSWICLGSYLVKPYRSNLPRTIAGCQWQTLIAAGIFPANATDYFLSMNITDSVERQSLVEQFAMAGNISLNSMAVEDPELTGINYIYKLSYILYGVFAIILVFLFGIPVSMCTGLTKMNTLNPNLVWFPYARFCSKEIKEQPVNKHNKTDYVRGNLANASGVRRRSPDSEYEAKMPMLKKLRNTETPQRMPPYPEENGHLDYKHTYENA